MSKHIHSEKAASPVAAYTQAVRAGDLVFVSGCIPIDQSTGELISDSIENATRQSLANVRNVLSGAGLELKDVVKASVFMIDSDDYAGMNAVYAEIMPQPFPAREAIFVKGLPKDSRVEISVIAYSPAKTSCC